MVGVMKIKSTELSCRFFATGNSPVTAEARERMAHHIERLVIHHHVTYFWIEYWQPLQEYLAQNRINELAYQVLVQLKKQRKYRHIHILLVTDAEQTVICPADYTGLLFADEEKGQAYCRANPAQRGYLAIADAPYLIADIPASGLPLFNKLFHTVNLREPLSNLAAIAEYGCGGSIFDCGLIKEIRLTYDGVSRHLSLQRRMLLELGIPEAYALDIARLDVAEHCRRAILEPTSRHLDFLPPYHLSRITEQDVSDYFALKDYLGKLSEEERNTPSETGRPTAAAENCRKAWAGYASDDGIP